MINDRARQAEWRTSKYLFCVYLCLKEDKPIHTHMHGEDVHHGIHHGKCKHNQEAVVQRSQLTSRIEQRIVLKEKKDT